MTKHYCKKCGTILEYTPISTRKFDEETGEKLYKVRVECPKRKESYYNYFHTSFIAHIDTGYTDWDLSPIQKPLLLTIKQFKSGRI